MVLSSSIEQTFHDFILCSDLDKLKEGIGEKLSIFTYLVMSFTISVIFSFFYGWKLTLVILSCAPIIILATAIVAKVFVESIKQFDRRH